MKNIKYAFFLLLMMSSLSCKKWLELKPTDGLVREDFWQTKEQLQSAVIGCYSSLLSPDLVQQMFVWGEARADMVASTNFTTINEVNLMNAEIQSTNPLTNWNILYSIINNCNTVIEYGPEVIKHDNTINQEQLDAYIAEARGIRAYMYFYLLRVWGEAPLQLKGTVSDAKIDILPKSSQEEIYNQIVEDLNFAAEHAVTTFRNQDQDKGRMTRYTIYALQADVYLWMDKYKECIEACDRIINSNRFGLYDGSNPSDWYSAVFFKGNSTESIFELQFDAQRLNPWFATFADAASRRYTAAVSVQDELFPGDPLKPEEKDIRGDGGSYRGSDLVIWKHAGTLDANAVVTQNTSTRHWFVYRYADILLMKAEALAWVNKGQDALALIDIIRARAHALETTLESPDPNSPQAVSDYILKERAREFAFEGKRWFDLLRNAKRNNYARLDIITSMISRIAPPDRQQSMITKYQDVRSHFLPISISELQANKLLKQNPFYQ